MDFPNKICIHQPISIKISMYANNMREKIPPKLHITSNIKGQLLYSYEQL